MKTGIRVRAVYAWHHRVGPRPRRAREGRRRAAARRVGLAGWVMLILLAGGALLLALV